MALCLLSAVCLLLSFKITSSQNIDQIVWTNLNNYTCSILSTSIAQYINITLSQCQSKFLSDHLNECVEAVWYEYIKPIGVDLPRCYLFDKSCELIMETTKPVVSSLWHYNISNDMQCINYPLGWDDTYFDDCDAYSKYNWCDAAYNSSTTAILSYTDRIYGLSAINSCCDCNGGLYNYYQTYLFEPIWKATSKLIVNTDDDFMCKTLDFADTLLDDININENDKLNLTQFIGLCEYFHSSLYDQYKLLLSINTNNNDLLYERDIHRDFRGLTDFDCTTSLYLYNVTICQKTDYNNLFPFIIDINENHIYINNYYMNTQTFINGLSPININQETFCSFETFLNTSYPTVRPTTEPTLEPTLQPSNNPTNDPTMFPTVPTLNPSESPTKTPTNEPTIEPTKNPTISPTSNPTVEPTTNPTKDPTKQPTLEPTNDPSYNPTESPTLEPTSNPTSIPSETPTTEPTTEPTAATNPPTQDPTIEPTIARRRLQSSIYFKTNIIAVVLCDTRYTRFPTLAPTVIPTESPSDPLIIVFNETMSSTEAGTTISLKNNTINSGSDVGLIVGTVVGSVCFCYIIIGLIVFVYTKTNIFANIFPKNNEDETTEKEMTPIKVPKPSAPPADPVVELVVDKECKICYDREKTHVAQCGHQYCEECINKVENCSFCNKPIENRIKLYH